MQIECSLQMIWNQGLYEQLSYRSSTRISRQANNTINGLLRLFLGRFLLTSRSSDFPSLANPSTQQNSSVWGSQRPAPPSRPQQSQTQPEESFHPPSQGATSRIIQYGSQNIITQSSHANPSEEYPPLGGPNNGDIQPSRISDLTSSNGFGSTTANSQRGGANGLLSAVTENNTIGSGSRLPPSGNVPTFRPSAEGNNRQALGAADSDPVSDT